MKSIAISNNKGGVGKTTTAGSLAYLLSFKGRTCLIDCDSQGSATEWLLTDDYKHELADVLSGAISPAEALIKVRDGFYMLPTRPGGNLRTYGETKINDEPFIFDDLKESLRGLDFDYIIFDLSPALGKIERAVLTAADEVITPITPEYFSVRGIRNFIIELEKMKKNLRINIQHNKIVCNNVNLSITMHKDTLEGLQGIDYSVYVIPQDAEIRKAQESNQAIFDYNPQARSIEYYNILAGAY